ncbi:BON domain-containing protein [Acinetobacter sp. B5B]|uniref:BON domain-containing protein n=1 Tax=Acinetobacter baretiae TaxID=2605383 RepID=UPI0018C1F3B6|nr:BON domain-containing protein [Acinetobacter baretiae]MBF7682866.1 BON domain-containing protein [Acinetobacter baretiae]MBF7684834.1 BON domain-containing protein [Acinetobacter baretiae]
MSKRIVLSLLCVASLSGCASFIAGGTGSAPVGTQNGVRSLGQAITDKSIERTAYINLFKLDYRFRQSRVNINSFFGSVLLTGQVPDASLKKLAEDNLKAMSDVRSVHNYITVGPQIGYTTIMQDTAVTANTRGLIAKAAVISDSKVSVHTEDGILYVMGRLNQAEMADLKQVLEQVGNVTKIVTLIDSTDISPTTQPVVQTPVAIDSNARGASTTPYSH